MLLLSLGALYKPRARAPTRNSGTEYLPFHRKKPRAGQGSNGTSQMGRVELEGGGQMEEKKHKAWKYIKLTVNPPKTTG